MPVVNTLDLVHSARRDRYAVPAVNIVDELSMRAVVAAAERAQSPVIIQTSVKTVKLTGSKLLYAIFREVAENSTTSVSLHLDHCPDPSVVTEVIAAGWSSVLYDASHLDLSDAIATTQAVAERAHDSGVAVESEIENIVGVEDGVGSDEAVHSYTDEQLVDVAAQTGVDLIAPALGTAHGLYKAAPVLRFERVQNLRLLTNLPLVLHGGTGLSESEFARFIEMGISKVNISTAVKRAYMLAAREHLLEATDTDHWEPTALFSQISNAVEMAIITHIEYFRSAGRIAAGRPAGANS